MTPDLIYGFADQEVQDAAHLRAQHQTRRLLVLNHYKRPVGFVSPGQKQGTCLAMRSYSLSLREKARMRASAGCVRLPSPCWWVRTASPSLSLPTPR